MTIAALLASLALLAAPPHALQLAQVDAPPTAADAPLATTNATAETQARADAMARGETPFPAGAPTDDYGLMGWCLGALSGHVGLYDRVLPEVRRIEGEFPEPGRSLDVVMKDYADQHAEGARLLKRYARALAAEEAAGKTRGHKRGAVEARGALVWKGSDKAEPRQLAQLWMSWGLPGRCQVTAARLAP